MMVVEIFMDACVNKNKILEIHAQWLHDNGYYKEFKDECVHNIGINALIERYEY